jgi:hypothetical protein
MDMKNGDILFALFFWLVHFSALSFSVASN